MRMELVARVRERFDAEDGATAVEYALMVALIAMVILAAVIILGQSTNELYQNEQLITSLS
ncbi:MAG TPA: Flp family type IVb pilin [Actinomycetota bacterium]|nr:Flp family type IVb pilin [Actinomycetota bacterium]